jgi:glycosyltransferase involved in cell wall biosynthesis
LTSVMWVAGLVPNKMGGFERMCAEVARQGEERNVDVQFVFEGQPCEALRARLSSSGAAFHVIPGVGSLRWKQALALCKLLRRVRPQAIHLHFCEFFVPFFPMAGLLRIPIIATYHYSGDAVPTRGIRRWLKQIRRFAFAGPIMRITAVSFAARDKFVGDYLVPRTQVCIIYNGTDEFDCGATPDIIALQAEEGPKAAFIGSLTREKGVHVAIRAVAASISRLPAIRLSIVGEGPELSNLKRLVTECGINDRVRFLGLRDDVGALLTQHDVMLAPSIWKEAFGYVLIEAMAAGCPTIASAVGGIPEVISDAEDGLLVPPDDPQALSEAIVRLWNDLELRARLVTNARTKVATRFSVAKIVRDYWDQYPKS